MSDLMRTAMQMSHLVSYTLSRESDLILLFTFTPIRIPAQAESV
jgi:hypothetical protein